MLYSPCTQYLEDRSLAYYTLFLSDGLCLNHLMESLVPMVNSMAAKILLRNGDADSCALDALERVLRVIQNHNPPCKNREFTGYLAFVVRKVLVQSYLRCQGQEFDYPGGATLPFGRVPDQEDVEYLLQYQQVRTNAREDVLFHIRFHGPDYAICCHALDWHIEGEGLDPQFLARTYRVPEDRVERLFDYTRVLWKKALHDQADRSALPGDQLPALRRRATRAADSLGSLRASTRVV